MSWLPPEPIHINGIIAHYVVRVTEVYTGRVFILLAEEATIQVGPLHPYYIYECQVAAYTVDLGPFGQPFTIQAGETGEKVFLLCLHCLSNCNPQHVLYYTSQNQLQHLKISRSQQEAQTQLLFHGILLNLNIKMGRYEAIPS